MLQIDMSPNSERRRILAERLADQLLVLGVAQVPLRDAAVILETSDRMLLYYFKTKSALISETLQILLERLATAIMSAIPPGERSPSDLLAVLLPVMRSQDVRPMMNIWSDLCARGGRGEEPFRFIATQLIDGWIIWISDRLAVADDRRRDIATAILTILEGIRQIEDFSVGAGRRAGPIFEMAFSKLY